MRWFPLSVTIITVLTVTGCQQDTAPKRPNVVLITLDTLRADHMSCYGYDRETTPVMDALAESGTRYTRAFTTAPWTLPTHASIFTGMFPAEHGVRRYKNAENVVEHMPIPEDLFTIGQVFDQLGYDSAAYTTNQAFVIPEYGFMRGIDHGRYMWMPAAQLVARVKRWLALEREAPFFLFLNFMDVHYPYNVMHNKRLFEKPVNKDVDLLGKLAKEVMPQKKPVPEDMRQEVIDQYDNALANLDEALGDLFQEMKNLGVYDNTVFVITSDHGEVFGEWEIVGHGKAMYTPLTRAVLLTHAPGDKGGAVSDEILSSVNIPHLILNTLPEKDAAPFRDKFPHRPGTHPITAENHYAIEHDLFNPEWGHRFDREILMWLDWPWKYVHASDDRHELYNLEDDPDEKDNRYEAEPDRAKAMADALKAWREPRLRNLAGSAPAAISEEDKEAMKALGYF